ncbi:hypothetical protein Ancab_029985 [Ancistrocladus abbreviatus]
MSGDVSAPTGCYKCGRPGHWSRDCPSSSSTNPKPNVNSSALHPGPSSLTSSTFTKEGGSAGGFSAKPISKASGTQKPVKVRRTRPKLDPELFLSDDGLGYILRYFPRNFKYRGRGYEVADLRNLLRMYKEWHSHLLPYYSFDQFVHKVEQVGSTKRVRACLRGLRERVANGGDPTKWNELPIDNEAPSNLEDLKNMEDPSHKQGTSSPKGGNADEMQEDILNEIYNQTVKEASQTFQTDIPPGQNMGKDSLVEPQDNGNKSNNPVQITDEQKARMEANKLKALERASARARLSSTA